MGSWFHMDGAETAKDLAPMDVRVRGITRSFVEFERNDEGRFEVVVMHE